MTLENKIEVSEKSLLKRFLNKVKNKVAPYVLASAAAISAMPGCSGGGGHDSPPAPTNQAPNITSNPVTSVWEGNSYNYDADATDPEGDNPIVYSLVAAPSWASIDSNTGIISGTPTGYSANAAENFTVRATDSVGNSRDQNFNVNVTNLGTVSGNVVDIDGNGLATKTVDLWNSIYAKGRFTATTDGSGNFTIADTVAGGNNIPNRSDWNYEIGDGYTGIFKFLRPNYATTGDIFTASQPQMILMHAISSTNSAYDNSLGNPSFLEFFKETTQCRNNATVTDTAPRMVRNWKNQYPVAIDFNVAGMASTDNVGINGAPGSDGKPDYQNALESAIAEMNTQVPSLLQTASSSPSNGVIKFTWPSTGPSGFTNRTLNTTDGSYDVVNIQVLNGFSYSVARAIILHEMWTHALDNGQGAHTADTLYIRSLTGPATTTHTDEARVAKYNKIFQHGTNMDEYVDQ